MNLTNAATANLIKRGRILTQLFVQPERRPSAVGVQIALLELANRGHFDEVKLPRLPLIIETIVALCDEVHLSFIDSYKELDIDSFLKVLSFNVYDAGNNQ